MRMRMHSTPAGGPGWRLGGWAAGRLGASGLRELRDRLAAPADEDRPVLGEGQSFGPQGGGGVVLHVADLELESVQPQGGRRALANLLLQHNSQLRALYRACW
jgi:hypothetical protein